MLKGNSDEMLSMAGPMAHGMARLDWGGYAPPKATSKAEILRLWDEGMTKTSARTGLLRFPWLTCSSTTGVLEC